MRRKGKVVEVVQSPADKPKDLRLGGNLVAAWSVATASLRWCALGRRGGRNLETGRRAATQPHFYRRINPPKSFTPVNNASPLPLSKLAPFEAQLRRVQFLVMGVGGFALRRRSKTLAQGVSSEQGRAKIQSSAGEFASRLRCANHQHCLAPKIGR